MKLKRFVAIVISLAMVLSIVPAFVPEFATTASAESIGDIITVDGIDYKVVSDNLVSNGTFESNADGWQTYNGSTLAAVNGSDIKQTTDKANSGSGSLQVVTNGGGTSAGSLVGMFPLDEDSDRDGDKYILTLYFNGGTGVTLTAGLTTSTTNVSVDIGCGGLGNSGSDPISCNVSGLTSGSWNKLQYVLTAKSDSAAAMVYARWCGGAYFDDVSLYKVEQVYPAEEVGDTVVVDGVEYTVNSANLVTNGSFEDESGELDVTGWLAQSTSANIPNPKTETADHFSAGTVSSYYYMGTEYALGAQYDRWGTKYTGPRRGNPTDGNWYLMTQWSDGFGGLCSIKRSFALESGKNYVMMYDIKSNSGNKTASNVYLSTTLAAGNGTAAGAITESWKTVSYFVEATDSVNTIWFNAYSMGNGICFDNFRLYEVELPAASTEASVAAALNKIVLPSSTKTDVVAMNGTTVNDGIADFDVTWTTSNASVISTTGTYADPGVVTVVTLTPSTTLNGATVTGDARTVYVFPQSVAGTEFNSGSGYYDIGTDNIISAQGTNASFENQSLEGWLAHTGATTNGAMVWVNSANAVVPDGEWAYASRWSDPITGSNYCTIDTMWEVEAGTYYLSFYAKKANGADGQVYVYYSTDNAHHTAVDQLTSEAWYEKVTLTDDWKKYEYIITADALGYIGFTGYNLGTAENGGTHFDDFELYTAVQAAEDLVSVTTPETVTVIAGNEPVLPATVTGVGERGSSMTVDVEWNSADFSSAGDVTVTGTAAGFPVSMTVTVLPMTFAVDGGTSNTTINFPADVTGDFYVEFDLTATNLDNLWIYISKDGALWGSGQIGLGFDNAGNGNFTAQPTGQTGDVFVTGKAYRYLVHGNVDTDTYDVVVYDVAAGKVAASVTGYGFRSASDAINSIAFTSNGEGGVGTLSNIKVYAPDQADLFKTITFVATGSVSDTYTGTYTSAEEFPIPHYDGHIMKTRTISGTTVTATYEATTTSIGSWYMRNNFTDDNWISQSKYIGSHNAFADTDDAFKNEGGALYGDDFTTASSIYVENSRTQSVGVVDQLNAGVRYFDIRLSRQEDGTFATVHGPAFENFRDVAISMAQWAKENPGEVIILDFQQVRDALYDNSTYTVITDNDSYYGPKAGDDNQYVYDALVQLFEETGLADYMTTNWDRKYGALTSSGTVTAILPFGKGRAVNCQGGYFVNRSALNNDVTYSDASDYDDIVSHLNETYANLTDGATISTIHAYSTPLSFLFADNLLEAAQANNPNWISESTFYDWMAYGKGDVLMMNDAVSDIDVYYAALNKFNRTGSAYSYTADFTRTDDNVTITGAQANVPFSTRWVVEPTANTNTYTIDGVEYTAHTAYTLDLMQFDRDSVQPTGTVTVTFPMISDGATTVDALLSADGTTVYATAGVGEAISIDTTSLVDVILATKVAPSVNVTVNYTMDGTTVYSETKSVAIGQDVYNVAASDRAYVKLGDKAYIASSTAQSHVAVAADEGTTKTVSYTLIEDNAVLEDMLVDPDNNIWGINSTDGNSIFVATNGNERCGARTDDDGNATSSAAADVLGSARNGYLQFPVVDLADGQAAVANFYVRSWHGYTFNLGNTWIKLSATAINDDSWTTMSNGSTYTDTAAPQFTGYTKTMFSNASANATGYIKIDVTDMMKAAKAAGLNTITIRLAIPYGAAYIAEREACVAGGVYEGNASYIDVVDGYKLDITGADKVTKMGTEVTDMTDVVVTADETFKIYDDTTEIVAYTDGTQVYGVNTIVTPEASGNLTPAVLGVAPVNGAQVRIGDGVDANGKVTAESGLRFITTVNYTDSLATVTGATFGVEITAEGSTAAAVNIPADKWQDGEAKTVFTSALTNLAVGNFNRKFTATPYVTADGQTFYGTPVTRSIYQVAAGLLTSDMVDTDDTEYGPNALATKKMYDVLNAYVNQTGIRLSVTSEGLTAYTGTNGAYSGDQFFEVVSSETVSENVYAITIAPAGDNTTINSYWQEYIRINNNNSKIAAFTSLVENEDGTVTITFDYASYLAQ